MVQGATSIASAELVEQMYKESSEELMHKSVQAALEQQDVLAEAATIKGGKTAAVKPLKQVHGKMALRILEDLWA